MPKVDLNGPWQAIPHTHPGGRWYVVDKDFVAVGVSMQPGIAREIAKLPELLEQFGEIYDLKKRIEARKESPPPGATPEEGV